MDQAIVSQAVSAAIVNVSGRQRMQSQRTALFCLRLVCSHNPFERQQLHQTLGELIALIERSHKGRIYVMQILKKPNGEIKCFSKPG